MNKGEGFALLAAAESHIFERQCKKPCKHYFEGESHRGPRTCQDFRAAKGKVGCAAYSYDKAAADYRKFHGQWDGAKDAARLWCKKRNVELSPEELGGLAYAAMVVQGTGCDEAIAYLRLLKNDDMAVRLVSIFDNHLLTKEQ